MPLTPDDVRNQRFKTAFRGYDEGEVDAFLDQVEVELERLHGELKRTQERLTAAESAPPPEVQSSEAEELLRRTLLLAQRTADETVAAAQADAERMTGEARAQADALVRQAHEQAAAATADLERRRQALEQHIEGLRAFEREYRTRLKAYLESQLRDLDGRAQPASEMPPAAPGAFAPAVPAAPPGGLPGVTETASFQTVGGFTPPSVPVVPPGPPAEEADDEYPDEDEPEVPRLAP